MIYQKTNLSIDTMVEIGDLNNGGDYYEYSYDTDWCYIPSNILNWMKSFGLYILINLYQSPKFQNQNNVTLENERKKKSLEQAY